MIRVGKDYLDKVKYVLERNTNLSTQGANDISNIIEELFKEGEIIDRFLSWGLRSYFYVLQDEGLLKVRREVYIKNNTEWREFYWRPNNGYKVKINDSGEQKNEEEDFDYYSLPEKIWRRN